MDCNSDRKKESEVRKEITAYLGALGYKKLRGHDFYSYKPNDVYDFVFDFGEWMRPYNYPWALDVVFLTHKANRKFAEDNIRIFHKSGQRCMQSAFNKAHIEAVTAVNKFASRLLEALKLPIDLEDLLEKK